ncbi:MAG: F0F1 ATP synthase subunit A, partial [Candidatus Diapherotrites archaeon]|nr:F0F1 ATP synthase subunit A [Candidatus Diapherotrites archaeon]
TFPVTNTLIMAVLVSGLLMVLGVLAGRRVALVPVRGIAHGMEAAVEALLGFIDSVTHDRERSARFLPYVATIFFFVIVSNWIELVPGLGTIGLWEEHGGERVLVPFIRSASADLNVTLAIALFSVIVTQIIGVRMVGAGAHLGKFFSFKNPIAFFVGILELISEFAKIISFSFRLFGNIFAGEVLLLVVATLVPYLVPLPFLFLELFVGFIQALVFAVLTLVNLNMAAQHAAH